MVKRCVPALYSDTSLLSHPGLQSVGLAGGPVVSLTMGLGASGLVPWGLWLLPRATIAQPGGPFGVAGVARGWVAGRTGSWVFYLLPFGVGGSSPHVPGHPTSMCDLGIK